MLIVSSVKGCSSWPYESAYHATKHALETLADSLRMEMSKFGVSVSLIQPGNFSAATGSSGDETVHLYVFGCIRIVTIQLNIIFNKVFSHR